MNILLQRNTLSIIKNYYLKFKPESDEQGVHETLNVIINSALNRGSAYCYTVHLDLTVEKVSVLQYNNYLISPIF